jgi:hypothetical protein
MWDRSPDGGVDWQHPFIIRCMAGLGRLSVNRCAVQRNEYRQVNRRMTQAALANARLVRRYSSAAAAVSGRANRNP